MRWVGRPLPRYEDRSLLRGRGRYTADLAGGARKLRFVRSPVACGRILTVNAPPEVPIITAPVLGDINPICPRLDRPDYVPVAQPILADERVNYVGEPIAAVIADTAAEAEDLAEQVAVEIAAETPVVTLNEALAHGAPLVHDAAAKNTLIDARFETPGVASALAAAQQVVEFTFTSGRQAAVPMETRGAFAAFDAATGRVTLSASTQMPHLLRTGIADILGIPESELRVIAPEVGGGFGQKMPLIPEYVIVVWAARRFACSVAWIEDRLENLTASFHARDQRLHLRGAFNADGRLVALDADVLCNIGAYSSFPVTAGVEPLMALADLPGPYRVPEYRARPWHRQQHVPSGSCRDERAVVLGHGHSDTAPIPTFPNLPPGDLAGGPPAASRSSTAPASGLQLRSSGGDLPISTLPANSFAPVRSRDYVWRKLSPKLTLKSASSAMPAFHPTEPFP